MSERLRRDPLQVGLHLPQRELHAAAPAVLPITLIDVKAKTKKQKTSAEEDLRSSIVSHVVPIFMGRDACTVQNFFHRP